MRQIPHSTPALQRGVTMVEILVTIVILSVSLLGIARLEVNFQINELESYQRAQALLLAKDMANRIGANRRAVAAYLTASAVGTGMTCPTTGTGSTLAQWDLAEWCRALQGAAEVVGTNRVGAMLGARGCIEQLADPTEYMITVAWQGMAPMMAPASSVTCGTGQYHTSNGSACDDTERCRRTLTTVLRLGALG